MAVDALRVSESKSRLIAKNVLDLILTLDIHGVAFYASPSHEKISGYPVKKFEGHRTADWIHQDDLPVIRKNKHIHARNEKAILSGISL